MPKEWEQYFPNLGNWTETSPVTRSYNCAAFAAGDTDVRWEPFPPGQYYWPQRVRRSYEVSAFVEAYKTHGFEVCADGSQESGYEKIVIYANEYGGAEHVSRQIAGGKWTSKMGDEEDIVHDTPESLGGGDYGQPLQYMRRPLKAKE
jgi:hypothetical protein